MIGYKREDNFRHKGLRKELIRVLIDKGITDKNVLTSIESIQRHWFLDPVFEEGAYEDKAMPIGEEQTISQPYTVAFQSQLLEITPRLKVLEIGTGSGYQACVLHKMGAKVYSIERNGHLFQRTKKFLTAIGFEKINLFLGDGTLGLPQFAPYDRIIVTAGAPDIPKSLFAQLKIGGILVIPVGDRQTQSMIKVIKDENGEPKIEKKYDFKFVPLLGKEGWS